MFQSRPPWRGEAGRGHGGLREAEAVAAAATAAAETAAAPQEDVDGKRVRRRQQRQKTQQNAKTRRCDAAEVRKPQFHQGNLLKGEVETKYRQNWYRKLVVCTVIE